VKTQIAQASLRNRIGALLHDNQLATVTELLVALFFQALHVAGLLPTETIPLLLLGWLSLWLRRSGWRHIGMARPASWWRTVLLGIGIGVALNALDWAVVAPLLHRVAGESQDLSQFDSLRGNVAVLVFWLTLAWTLGAFGEEMVWRGYIFNRLADLFGQSRAGWVLSLIIMGLLFGLGHSYLGITGVVDNILWGILYGALYLASGRNLWLPIVAHGVENTTSFVLLFFGLNP
jgi:membrane protease YdiL (CAAX protease family)